MPRTAQPPTPTLSPPAPPQGWLGQLSQQREEKPHVAALHFDSTSQMRELAIMLAKERVLERFRVRHLPQGSAFAALAAARPASSGGVPAERWVVRDLCHWKVHKKELFFFTTIMVLLLLFFFGKMSRVSCSRRLYFST